jgi:hypothetical protein
MSHWSEVVVYYISSRWKSYEMRCWIYELEWKEIIDTVRVGKKTMEKSEIEKNGRSSVTKYRSTLAIEGKGIFRNYLWLREFVRRRESVREFRCDLYGFVSSWQDGTFLSFGQDDLGWFPELGVFHEMIHRQEPADRSDRSIVVNTGQHPVDEFSVRQA